MTLTKIVPWRRNQLAVRRPDLSYLAELEAPLREMDRLWLFWR